jgi:hypothetical protein
MISSETSFKGLVSHGSYTNVKSTPQKAGSFTNSRQIGLRPGSSLPTSNFPSAVPSTIDVSRQVTSAREIELILETPRTPLQQTEKVDYFDAMKSVPVPSTKKHRIDYLAGLTAITCLLVTVVHFLQTFLPATITPDFNSAVHVGKSELWAAKTVTPMFIAFPWVGTFFTTMSVRICFSRHA